MKNESLTTAATDVFNLVNTVISTPAYLPEFVEVGTVLEVGTATAIVTGLERVLADEIVIFESGVKGIVFDLEIGRVGIILLGFSASIAVGENVYRSREVASVPVGDQLLGRIINALGMPIDELGSISATKRKPVEAEAPAIMQRAKISCPLSTGIKAIDAAVPIGRGQRELIIGDRQTGKTSIAVDTIINQVNTDVISIYCAIGQRGDAVARVIASLKAAGAIKNTVVMVAGGEEVPGLNYIAPYAAMTIAEYFCDQGRDVLIVFDDLTRHAEAYRELSLLLRRPPGREAYPGDIFYVHARLLERSGQFSAARGGGSLTALPVIETQAENLSAYISTNLISITDGQVYLSPHLVQKNQFPAVDLGKSVSRVGGKAQSPAFREIAGGLRVTLSQFEELENFSRFGTRLDDDTKRRLIRGAAVRAALRQPERDPLSAPEQLIVIQAAMHGLLDGFTEPQLNDAMDKLRDIASSEAFRETSIRITAGDKLQESDKNTLLSLCEAALADTHAPNT